MVRVGAADAQKLVKEIFPDLDFYELTLLPNRMFWIRPLVRGESKEAFTGGKDACHVCHYNPQTGNTAPDRCGLCHVDVRDIEGDGPGLLGREAALPDQGRHHAGAARRHGLALTMVAAIVTHVRLGETDRLVVPIVLLALALFVAIERFGALSH